MAIHKRNKSINDINAQVARIVNAITSKDRKRLAESIGVRYKDNIYKSKQYNSVVNKKKEEGYNNKVGRSFSNPVSRYDYSQLYADQEAKRTKFSQSTYRGLSEG